jgi:hypothetical protein
MTSNREADKPDPLEIEVLQDMRMMTPEARAEFRAIAALYRESFPLRPMLRLVQSSS